MRKASLWLRWREFYTWAGFDTSLQEHIGNVEVKVVHTNNFS